MGHEAAISEAIDRKFTFTAVSTEHGEAHDEWDAVLFLAHDAALPDTLRFYRAECERRRADPNQLRGIDLLLDRVLHWQSAHWGRVKTPDVHSEAITAPNSFPTSEHRSY